MEDCLKLRLVGVRVLFLWGFRVYEAWGLFYEGFGFRAEALQSQDFGARMVRPFEFASSGQGFGN